MTALYGLPEDVRFCTRCVMSNQRPNSVPEYLHTPDSRKATIGFDAEGVCDACRVAERKKATDWQERERQLRDLCDRYRKSDGYDCIVPGSGGKDSFYAAHRLKYDFGMHPLTVTWAPHMPTTWGRANFDAWLAAGFDNLLMTPNPQVHRLLTRLAVENLFHPFQPFVLGQKQMAPRLARLFNVPLVFYGENEAEYGNPQADAEVAVRDRAYYESDGDAHLSGVPIAELRETYGMDASELDAYLPGRREDGRGGAAQVHYLGYYLRWHPQSCYYYAVEHGGFEAAPERTPGTYSKYNSIDDKIDDFHYWTTYVKFGIGRATYDAAQEIRSGDITREEGVALVRRFDGEWPERFAAEVCRYLSVEGMPELTPEYLWTLSDKFRSPHLWDGRRLKHTVWEG